MAGDAGEGEGHAAAAAADTIDKTTGEEKPSYLNHWLVDRSRYEDGISWCPRARYLGYHAGKNGYGVRKRALSIPLTTGTYVHDLLAELLDFNNGEAGHPITISPKMLIDKHVAKYRKLCTSRGFADVTGEGIGDDAQRIIGEQAALIESIGWAAHLYWIPQLLEEFEVVIVEQEIDLPLETPEGAIPTIVMLRPDLVLRRKIDGSLAQVDFKTVADPSYVMWRRQWEDNGQLTLQGLGASHLLGERVDISYIFAIVKGRRSKDKDQIERTWSPFLNAYRRPPNPPMVEEDWKIHYEWQDEDGQTRRVSKQHQRVFIREYQGFNKPAGMSNQEYWVRALPDEDVQKQREILGPFISHSHEQVLRAVAAEEQRWQQKLWAIYDAREKAGGDVQDPEYQAALDREAPQTWFCHKYGKDCQFLPICKREPGWDDPTGGPGVGAGYVERTPHHAQEVQQMAERGIEVPKEEGEEVEGE